MRQLADEIEAIVRDASHDVSIAPRVAGLGAPVPETLRALREARSQVARQAAAAKELALAAKAALDAENRALHRIEMAALAILRAERERCGAMSDAGMYKVVVGDGDEVALISHPSQALLCTPDAVDRLPDEYVKVTREIRKDLVTAELKRGGELPGCQLVPKTWTTDPPAAETVRWET